MQKVIFFIFFAILLGLGTMTAQKKLLKKANTHYKNLAYNDAINLYEQIVDSGKADFDVYKKLGDSYYYNSDLKKALKSYQKMLTMNKNVPAEYYARTASALKNDNKIEAADNLLKELKALEAEGSRFDKLAGLPDYLREITATSGRYAINNMNTNSTEVDFAPAFFKDEVVFSSARNNEAKNVSKNKWTGQSYLTLMKAAVEEGGQLQMPEIFSKKLDAQLHESTAAFTKDGQTVYFTRNNIEGIGFKTDSTGQVRLKIFRAQMGKGGYWKNIEELPFNSNNYSVAHPALSADEKQLYFASDMPPTRGMSDIFKVEINEDGSFGDPANLGSHINTEGRETFPFVSEKGTLYFSSDGHLGLGGLDIFAAGRVLENKVLNVGTPINSSADDITFIINDSTGKGYFASNRKGGKGDDDLYSFEESKSLVGNCFGNLELTVLDEVTNKPIKASMVEFKTSKGETAISDETDYKGMITSNYDCADVSYNIHVSKEDYMTKIQDYNASWSDNKPSIEVKLLNVFPKLGKTIGSILNIKSIFYQYNKTAIIPDNKKELDQVLAYLKRYPKVHIQLISYADSRGGNDFNFELSKNRSIVTAEYLIRNGIARERMKLYGQGELKILNKCLDNIDCEEEEHLRNRRAEFVIVKL